MDSVMIDGHNADFFHTASTGPQKALVMLGGSEGGRYWSYHPELIRDLVDQGFCILSLPYFGTRDFPHDLRSIPLEYFARVFRWLSTQKDQVIPDNYALVGVSRGAELALLLGSRYPEVKAVVAIAPGSVVFPGPPTGILDLIGGRHSAWSEKGQELPFVPIPYSWATLRECCPVKEHGCSKNALNTRRVKEAEIPAEKIRGPILLISFTRDQVWPSTFMCEQITTPP